MFSYNYPVLISSSSAYCDIQGSKGFGVTFATFIKAAFPDLLPVWGRICLLTSQNAFQTILYSTQYCLTQRKIKINRVKCFLLATLFLYWITSEKLVFLKAAAYHFSDSACCTDSIEHKFLQQYFLAWQAWFWFLGLLKSYFKEGFCFMPATCRL